MNKTLKYISLGLLATPLFLACQKEFEEIVPSGEQFSLKQVKESANLSEETRQAGLSGMYAQLTSLHLVYDDGHDDFGYPSYALLLEHAGDNVVGSTAGYNWFNGALKYEHFSSKIGRSTNKWWTFSYKNIKIANELISTFAGTTDPESMPILGQAKAMRAWNYFNLARLYQKTYLGNQNAPCVPIVTEATTTEQVSNNPRATVQAVYDLILADLKEATELLKDFKPASKANISEAVAYGIRARVHLTMGKYAEAVADAQKAIDTSGATPFSIEDCSIPNFDDVQTAGNTMWGIIITNEDEVSKTSIINFTSMFCSLSMGTLSYTTGAGQFKRINSRLYAQIPTDDVRKGWWTAKPYGNKYTSPLLEKAYPNDLDKLAEDLPPLASVKFAPTDKNINATNNSTDYPLMRIEEMYYIIAEAKAMSGDLAGGKAALVNFEKMYRNPSFTSYAADAKSLQDEIYTIKRYEFWGECISWFDMLRLNKGVDRVDVENKKSGGYPPTTRFNIPAGDPNLIFMIPLSEEQNNKAIEGHNNPLATEPKDMI